MKLSCITLDDEPFALKLISNFVNQHEDLELKSSFNSVKNTLDFLESNSVDCIFLDIEIPNCSGIELANLLIKKHPKIALVFVSAYSKYAIDGFKVSATDFLLKPYSYQDFEKTVEKIKLQKRLEILNEKEEIFIFLKVDSIKVKIRISEILYAESMKDYVKIYTENRLIPYIPLMTLKKLSEILNDDLVQVNRSQIVNFKKIESFRKNSLILNNKEFIISEKYKSEFFNKVNSL